MQSEQSWNVLLLHTARLQRTIHLQLAFLHTLRRSLKTESADGVLDFGDGVGEEVDVIAADGHCVLPVYSSFRFIGVLPLHPHLGHDLILDLVGVGISRQGLVELRLFSNGFLVLVFAFEAGSHAEDAVSALAAEVLAGVDAGLVVADGCFEEVEHVVAGEGQSVFDGLAHFGLPQSLEGSHEGRLEVVVLLGRVCVGRGVRFLKIRSSSFW